MVALVHSLSIIAVILPLVEVSPIYFWDVPIIDIINSHKKSTDHLLATTGSHPRASLNSGASGLGTKLMSSHTKGAIFHRFQHQIPIAPEPRSVLPGRKRNTSLAS